MASRLGHERRDPGKRGKEKTKRVGKGDRERGKREEAIEEDKRER